MQFCDQGFLEGQVLTNTLIQTAEMRSSSQIRLWSGGKSAKILEKSQNSSAAADPKCSHRFCSSCSAVCSVWHCCPQRQQCWSGTQCRFRSNSMRWLPSVLGFPVGSQGAVSFRFRFALGAGTAFAWVLFSSLAWPQAPVWGLFPQQTALAKGADMASLFKLANGAQGQENGHEFILY